MSPVLRRKNIKIKLVDNTDNNYNVFVDGQRFQQILIKLIENAYYHSFKSDTIILTLNNRDEDESLNFSIEIKDQGKGIDSCKL